MIALMNWAGMLFILQGHMNYAQMLQVYNLVLFSLTFGTALLDFSMFPLSRKNKANIQFLHCRNQKSQLRTLIDSTN